MTSACAIFEVLLSPLCALDELPVHGLLGRQLEVNRAAAAHGEPGRLKAPLLKGLLRNLKVHSLCKTFSMKLDSTRRPETSKSGIDSIGIRHNWHTATFLSDVEFCPGLASASKAEAKNGEGNEFRSGSEKDENANDFAKALFALASF
jgi:hypothetical protein